MSNSGIIVYNNDKNLVLDNSYKNFYVSRVITLTGAGTTTGTFASGEYLAAVGGVSSMTIDAYCENTMSGWTCYVKTWQSGLRVYVLSTNVPDTAHGVGLEIWDASGKVIFNSNVNPARVLAFGHTEQGLPTDGSPLYAIAVGSPIYETEYDTTYDQQVRNSETYHPEQWHNVVHPRETKLEYVAEKWHYEYDTSTEPWTMKKVVDEPAHYETVVVHEAYTEKVIDQEAYTEYTTTTSIYETGTHTETWKNFEIRDGRIVIQQRDLKYGVDINYIPYSTSTETSTLYYPSPAVLPSPISTYSDYVVNPTSFLLVDVRGC